MRKGYHRPVGRRNYLIAGHSGAGKTAVCAELQRRGYQAIHGDRELVYRGDPETGLPVAPEAGTPTATWISEHHIWDIEKVQALVANQEEAVTFFCGGSRNFAKFIDLFDGVFVLEVDLDTMNRRIDERVALDPTDWGGKPEERELAVRLHQTQETIPNNGIVIDATAQLAHVVDEILRLSDATKPV
jgi:adenylate kinase family enzyme